MCTQKILSVMRPLVLVTCSALLFCAVPVQAADNAVNSEYVLEEQQIETPRYVGLTEFSTKLEINSNGYATCVADIRTDLGYTCDATLELQQKSGSSWETVKEWSSSGRVNEFDEGWYVVRGDYRLKASALVFDPTGRLVENQTAYSSVVEY